VNGWAGAALGVEQIRLKLGGTVRGRQMVSLRHFRSVARPWPRAIAMRFWIG
jgi:hypothetical protein